MGIAARIFTKDRIKMIYKNTRFDKLETYIETYMENMASSYPFDDVHFSEFINFNLKIRNL